MDAELLRMIIITKLFAYFMLGMLMVAAFLKVFIPIMLGIKRAIDKYNKSAENNK